MTMPTVHRHYRDVHEIKQANRAAGYHFFEPSTMRFFRSRVGDTVYGGRYFVTSEQFDWSSPRLYTVRVANDDRTIDDVGGFQAYPTHTAAVRAIRRLIAQGAN